MDVHRKKTDADLVERCIKKDPAAWAELSHKYSRLIAIAVKNRLRKYGICFSNDDVADIGQEVMLSLWKDRALQSVRQRENISYWLAMVAGNAALRYMRTKNRMKNDVRYTMGNTMNRQLTEEIIRHIPDRAKQPDEEAAHCELLSLLEDSLHLLNRKEALVMKLHLFFNKGYADIAAILRLPRGTVSNYIKRAKEKLKEAIRKKM